MIFVLLAIIVIILVMIENGNQQASEEEPQFKPSHKDHESRPASRGSLVTAKFRGSRKSYLTKGIIATMVIASAFVIPGAFRGYKCRTWYDDVNETEMKTIHFAISGEGGKRAFLDVCTETGQPMQAALLLRISLDASRASYAQDAASAEQLRQVESDLKEAIRRERY